MPNYVGIDLGTTFSCISVLGKNKKIPKTLEVGGTGIKSMPSVVYYGGNNPQVGKVAKKHLVNHPDKTVELAKSYLGSNKRWSINGKEYTPVDVLSEIIKELMKSYRAEYNDDEYECVMTCPANYKQDKKRLLKDAAQKAGVNVKCLLNEPTAAALTFFCDDEDSVGKTIVIFDLGGGTFDVTVATSIANENGIPQYHVRSSKGEEFLGGAQWDERVHQLVLKQCSETTGISSDAILSNETDKAGLRRKSEDFKKDLSFGDLWDEVVLQGLGGKVVDITIPVSTFESYTSDLLERVLNTFDEALSAAYRDERSSLPVVTEDSIYKIVMVGGSCRMPQVRNGIIDRHPSFESKIIMRDPDESICKGAAIYSSRAENGNDYLFLDKLSNTFGIACFVDDNKLDQKKVEERYYSEKVPGLGYRVCRNMLYKGIQIPYSMQKEYLLQEKKNSKVELVIYQNDVSLESKEEYTDPKKCKAIYKEEFRLGNKESSYKLVIKMSIEVSGDLFIEMVNENGVAKELLIKGDYQLSDSKKIDKYYPSRMGLNPLK